MNPLLDANAFIDYLRRGPRSKVAKRIAAVPAGSIRLCTIVLGELIFGAIRGDPAREAESPRMIAELQSVCTLVSFDEAAAEEYARLRPHLTRAGTMIGANDLMIASSP